MSNKNILPLALATAIELSGVFIVAIGIATELSTGADFGHYIISVGSVVISTGSILWAKIFGRRR